MRLTPYDSTTLAQLLTSPLSDLYLANGERYVWLVCDIENDLQPARVADGTIGGAAELDTLEEYERDWLEYELEAIGFDWLLMQTHRVEDMASWLLECGIAPGQPFLVHFDPPTYTKTWTDCGYEYDSIIDYDIVSIVPMAVDVVVNAWIAWLAGPEPRAPEFAARIDAFKLAGLLP